MKTVPVCSRSPLSPSRAPVQWGGGCALPSPGCAGWPGRIHLETPPGFSLPHRLAGNAQSQIRHCWAPAQRAASSCQRHRQGRDRKSLALLQSPSPATFPQLSVWARSVPTIPRFLHSSPVVCTRLPAARKRISPIDAFPYHAGISERAERFIHLPYLAKLIGFDRRAGALTTGLAWKREEQCSSQMLAGEVYLKRILWLCRMC